MATNTFGSSPTSTGASSKVRLYRLVGSLRTPRTCFKRRLLAAWRGLEQFEDASIRTLAVSDCHQPRARRAAGSRSSTERNHDAPPRADALNEPLWLDRIPTSCSTAISRRSTGPEARYETREAISRPAGRASRRAPARGARAPRDGVLGYRAAEAAELLDTTETSVNSLLRRARAAFDTRLPRRRPRAPLRPSRNASSSAASPTRSRSAMSTTSSRSSPRTPG